MKGSEYGPEPGKFYYVFALTVNPASAPRGFAGRSGATAAQIFGSVTPCWA